VTGSPTAHSTEETYECRWMEGAALVSKYQFSFGQESRG